MMVHYFILILLVFVTSTHSLLCYEGFCQGKDTLECSHDEPSSGEDDYCVIIEQRFYDVDYIFITRVHNFPSYVEVEDTYHILVIDSIRYNQTANKWYTWPAMVMFGCDWDLCNAPDIIDKLPDSFSVTMNETWLNENIYGTGSVDSCNYCPRGICANNETAYNMTECPMTNCTNNETSVIRSILKNMFSRNILLFISVKYLISGLIFIQMSNVFCLNVFN